MATRKKLASRTTRGSSHSGLHAGERRKITATAEQFQAMDAQAEREGGMSWAQWALAILLAKISAAKIRESRQTRR